MANTLTRFGVTWTFDKDLSDNPADAGVIAGTKYLKGQYVNGDWWVHNAAGDTVVITEIDPKVVIADGDTERPLVKNNNADYFVGTLWWSGTYWCVSRVAGENSQESHGWHWRRYDLDPAGMYQYWHWSTTASAFTERSNRQLTLSSLPNISNFEQTGDVEGVLWADASISQRFNWDYGPYVPTGDTMNGETVYTNRYSILNGSMINPDLTDLHGYDSAATRYDPSLNVAASLPLSIQVSEGVPLKTLLSARSNLSLDATQTFMQKFDALALLTIEHQIPAANSFRPSYMGDHKAPRFTASDIVWENLANLAIEAGWAGDVPTINDAISDFTGQWYHHSEHINSLRIGGSTAASYETMSPSYGRSRAIAANRAALLLSLRHDADDATNDAIKEPLLAKFLQTGLDVFGCYHQCLYENYQEGYQAGDGGIFSGNLVPLIFAAITFDSQDIKNIFAKSGMYRHSTGYPEEGFSLPSDYIHIQELDQTFYVTQRDIGISTGSMDPRDVEKIPLSVDMLGLPEYAIRYALQPERTNAYIGASYRGLNSNHFPAASLAIQIIGGKAVVNNDAFFDYADRWVVWHGGENPIIGMNQTFNTLFEKVMWESYRENYGPLWTATLSVTAEATTIDTDSIVFLATPSGGTGAKTYQWQEFIESVWTDITGAESATYTAEGLQPSTSYTFRVVVTDSDEPPVVVTYDVTATTTASEGPTPQYLLTKGPGITVSGASPVEGNYYEAGAVLTLTAVGGRYALFSGWSGDASGTRKQIQITMDSVKTVTANFVEAERKTNIVIAGSYILLFTTKHEVTG